MMRKLAAVVIVAVAFVVAGSARSQASVTTTKPVSAVDLSSAPRGWVPVAYGDAQVSVPPTWYVMTSGWCGTTWPPIIQLGNVVQNAGCSPPAPSPPTVRITPLGEVPAPYRQEQPIRLDGISVLLGPNSVTFISYFVPSLHVEVWASGEMGKRVIETLAVSPRVTALASGSAPAIPPSWRTLALAGLRFSVPAGWPVQRTTTWNICGLVQIALPERVVLDSDKTLQALPCPFAMPFPVTPTNGFRVDTGAQGPTGSFAPGGACRHVGGLRVCPSSTPDYSISLLKVTVPGRSKPVYVSIGLAGNGMVARTILYSLRAA